MTISPFSKLHNEVKIVHGKNIKDSRGNFKKTIFGSDLKSLMPEPSEVLNSVSHKNVVRGLHFQNPPNEVDKFITCLYGEINDVFLNIYLFLKSSESFSKSFYTKKNIRILSVKRCVMKTRCWRSRALPCLPRSTMRTS